MSRLEPRPKLPEAVVQSMAYDFSQLDDEDDDDDDRGSLWEIYTDLCYSQHPPIPALSLMRPILAGDESSSALFSHQEIGKHLPIILRMLAKVKISDLILNDNSLDASCVPPLIEFLNATDSLSTLNLNNNPMIKAKAMTELLEGIKEGNSLESLSISNTGCGPSVGVALAEFVTRCESLNKLDLSCCSLRQSGNDFAVALGGCAKLETLDMSDNELCLGGRRLAQNLGTSIAKAGALKCLLLARNALNDEMTVALLRGLSDAPALKQVDLSENAIGEASGRAIAGFISKAGKVKDVNISMNPLLNVTFNQRKGQETQEGDDGGKGNKKDKKPKAYVASVYSILNAASKARKMTLKMIGLIVDPAEWEKHMEPIASMQNIHVITQVPRTESFNFRKAAPAPSE